MRGSTSVSSKFYIRARQSLASRLFFSGLAAAFLFGAAPEPSSAATISVCDVSSLNSAVSDARPGDVIKMCNGTWRNSKVLFEVRGTQLAPITLKAETPGRVILSGSSQLYIAGKFAVVDGLVFKGTYTGSDTGIIRFQNDRSGSCIDCRLTNVSVLDYSPTDPMKNTKWVVMHGQRNRVDHCHFRGKTNLGAMVQIKRIGDGQPNYHRIDHNLFESRPDLTMEGSNQNGDTLEIGSQSKFGYEESRSTIEYNYLLDINSNYEVITVKSSGNTLRYNVLDASAGVLSLRQGSNNVVDGNFILGRGKSGTGGIRVTGSGHTIVNNYIADVNPLRSDAKAPIVLSTGTDELVSADPDVPPYYHYEVAENVTVAHNTVVDSGLGVLIGQGTRPRSPRNIDIHANALLRIDGVCSDHKQAGANIAYSDNVCYGGNNTSSRSGIASYNPGLAIDSRGVFRPSSNSRIVDATSKAVVSGLKDMDGQSRSTMHDIGADEFVSGSKGRGAIELCDTGPVTYRNGSCVNRPPPVAPTGFTVM